MSSARLKVLIVTAILLIAILAPIIPSPPTVRTVTYTSSSPKVITRTVTKSKVLFEGKNLYIPFMGYRYSGPYYLKAGQTITVSWDADTIVNVYIMNDVDWGKRFFGAPTSWRASRSDERGYVSYTLRYDEPIYVQVMTPTWVSALCLERGVNVERNSYRNNIRCSYIN